MTRGPTDVILYGPTDLYAGLIVHLNRDEGCSLAAIKQVKRVLPPQLTLTEAGRVTVFFLHPSQPARGSFTSVTADNNFCFEMRAASPPRSPRSQCALKRGVPRCAAPLLLLAAWLGGCSAADPPVDTTVSGGSNEATGDAGALTYTKQGTTASGAPYYKADGSSFWLYWDPDCDGRGRPPLWILKFDDNAPSTTASSDLDEDSECQFSAYIRSADSSSPPHGRFAWRVHCGRVAAAACSRTRM